MSVYNALIASFLTPPPHYLDDNQRVAELAEQTSVVVYKQGGVTMLADELLNQWTPSKGQSIAAADAKDDLPLLHVSHCVFFS